MENTHTRRTEGFDVRHTITGSKAYVEAETERVLRDYPAPGYGTRVIGNHNVPDADTYSVYVIRSASCD